MIATIYKTVTRKKRVLLEVEFRKVNSIFQHTTIMRMLIRAIMVEAHLVDFENSDWFVATLGVEKPDWRPAIRDHNNELVTDNFQAGKRVKCLGEYEIFCDMRS